jgi:hypothetical protein
LAIISLNWRELAGTNPIMFLWRLSIQDWLRLMLGGEDMGLL